MSSAFEIFRKDTTPNSWESVVQKLQKPKITSREIAELLSIPQGKVTELLKKIKPIQWVTKERTWVWLVFTITQTWAIRILEWVKDIPKKHKHDTSIDVIDTSWDILFFRELMTLSNGRLSQPIWTAMIKDNPLLFIRKSNNGPRAIKRADLQKFLELIEPTDRARKKII